MAQKLKPGCFPYECEEKALVKHREHEAEEVLRMNEKVAAQNANRMKVNPRVTSVSLWTLHGKKKSK